MITNLSQNHIRTIFCYLDYKEVALSSIISKNWLKSVRLYFENFPCFELSNTVLKDYDSEGIAGLMNYYRKYIQPQHLIVTADGIFQFCFKPVFEKPNPRLRKLVFTIPDDDEAGNQSYILSAVKKSFPGLQEIRIYGNVLSETCVVPLAELETLERLAVLSNSFSFEGKHLRKFQPLQAIEINVPSLSLENLKPLLAKSAEILDVLYLDVDNYGEDELTELVDMIAKAILLKKLHLQYCSNLNTEHFMSLSPIAKHIEILKIKKVSEVNDLGYETFFSNSCPNLRTLILPMNSWLSDKALELVSVNCLKLCELDISWCERITDASLSVILERCNDLQSLNIVGLKSITEKSFRGLLPALAKLEKNDYQRYKKDFNDEAFRKKLREELFGKELSTTVFHQLKYLNASKCDFIPDNIFMLMKLLNFSCEALNYYGEDY